MAYAMMATVSVLVGCAALAFYMNWLGLWVSKAEMRELRARSAEQMQELRSTLPAPGPEKAPLVTAGAGNEDGEAKEARALPQGRDEMAKGR